MARPTTLKSSKFTIQIGDGASPEVFSAPCTLNNGGITFTNTPGEFNVPDCTDKDAPIWIERTITSQSATVTGDGLMAVEDWDIWTAWEIANGEKNIRVNYEGLGYWAMSAVLTSLGNTAPLKELVQLSVEMMSNGEVTWTPAP